MPAQQQHHPDSEQQQDTQDETQQWSIIYGASETKTATCNEYLHVKLFGQKNIHVYTG